MSQRNCVNTALPLPQNSCHHFQFFIIICHEPYIIIVRLIEESQALQGSQIQGQCLCGQYFWGRRPSLSIFSWSEIQWSHGKTHKYHSIRIQEILNSQKKNGKSFVCFLLFFAEHQNLYVAKLRSILSHAATWGILGLGVEASWMELVQYGQKARRRGLIEKRTPRRLVQDKKFHQLFPLTDNFRQFQHPQVKKVKKTSTIFYNTLQNKQSADPKSESAWPHASTFGLRRLALTAASHPAESEAQQRGPSPAAHVPCHTMSYTHIYHAKSSHACNCLHVFIFPSIPDIHWHSFFQHGSPARPRGAPTFRPHSPQQTCPQLHRTSSPSIILTNAHYGWEAIFKTFKDTAPGHLTHIFCHTVISKLYQFVMLSRASTPCFISSRSAPTWPSAAAKCAGVAPLPQKAQTPWNHTKPENKASGQVQACPVSTNWTKFALGSWLHGSEREMPAWSNGVMTSDWPPEMVN